MGIVSKTVGVYKRYGLKGFCTKLNEKISSPMRTYGKRVAEFLPTEEELKAEIETQKAMFYLQQKESKEEETEE